VAVASSLFDLWQLVCGGRRGSHTHSLLLCAFDSHVMCVSRERAV